MAPAASQQRTSQISLSSLVHFVKEQVRVTVQPSRRSVGGAACTHKMPRARATVGNKV